MGSRGAFEDVNMGNFAFKAGGQHYKSIGILSSNPNVKVIVQDSNNVKAPEYSHTAGRIYAVVKAGELKHLAYYDENHKQAVSIDLAHAHRGVQPHRHVYLSHNKNDPGIPPTSSEMELIRKIKKEFHLK
uniref:Uncharacterized protein n=1 Tax=Eubacterium cellulosolvens (strain ATCC 43171 / JCM 9499 / 6) TaxID=633697 RepID=I5AVI9_EUBC6